MFSNTDPLGVQFPKVLEGERFELTGSVAARVYNPKDIDYFVVYSDALYKKLDEQGWARTEHARDRDYPNDSVVQTWRLGKFNIIMLRNERDYKRWLIATQLLQAMRLQEKEQRVVLFQFITEGCIRGNKFPTTLEIAQTLVADGKL